MTYAKLIFRDNTLIWNGPWECQLLHHIRCTMFVLWGRKIHRCQLRQLQIASQKPTTADDHEGANAAQLSPALPPSRIFLQHWLTSWGVKWYSNSNPTYLPWGGHCRTCWHLKPCRLCSSQLLKKQNNELNLPHSNDHSRPCDTTPKKGQSLLTLCWSPLLPQQRQIV